MTQRISPRRTPRPHPHPPARREWPVPWTRSQTLRVFEIYAEQIRATVPREMAEAIQDRVMRAIEAEGL